MLINLYIAGSVFSKLPAIFLLIALNYNVIIITDTMNNEIYAIMLLKKSDTFTVQWIHSVEHTPWQEVFFVNSNNHLILIKSRFKSFGAGVPYDIPKNKLTIRNGWIEYLMENEMEAITYNISKNDYMLILKEASYMLTHIIGGKKAVTIKPVKYFNREQY
jgi:hypothetical protein